MLKENRLIGITQAALDKQKKAAGQTPISTAKPTSVSTQTGRMSAAEANANLQNIQRANTLSTKPGEVKSYIDPKTGVDTRYMVNGVDTRTINKPLYQDFEVGKDAEGKPIYEQRLVANPGQMANGTLSSFDSMGVQFQNTGSGGDAFMSLVGQGGQTAGYTSPYNMPSASSLGQIDQSAYNRLLEAGRTPQQALAEIQGNRPDVQAAFNQVGTGLRPQTLEQRQQAAAAGAAQRLRDMGVGDPNLINQAASQAAQDVLNQDTAQIQNQTALSEQQRQQAAATAASGAAANKSATTANTGISPEIEAALAGLPPIEAGLIRAQLQAGNNEAAAGQNAALQNFAAETKAADASLNAYDKVLDKAEADSKQLYEASRDIVEDSEDRQKENLAREQQNALEQLAWAEQKATRDGKIALRKQMDSMTAAQALSGGYGSSNWNAELEQAEFDGERAIAEAQQQFAFKRADVAIAYTNSLNTIYDNAAVRKLEALKAYKSDLATNNQYRFSATEKTEERKVKAKQDLNNSLATIAKEQATGIKDAIKEVRASLIQDKETKAAQETMGWNMLAKAVDVYGTNVPQAMIDSIKTKLPGVDIASVVKTPTLEQLKKMKSSGGGSGLSFGSGVPSPQEALTASMFANVTPQTLSEVVDRVVREFGGTGSEREEARGKYRARIQRGESPASIIESLKNDFWSASKGAPRTAHDGRTEAQASAESLQSFVDHYGLSSLDEGVLGPIDSRKQALASWFNMGSEEYLNLANNVGNIRARIIKENYGAAVTPQELDIAKSYIPSMEDHGAQFVTKLQNLKAYNAYLDAKVFASASGLPPPAPPSPVTLSGDKVAGPSKYSAADITSALSE